jgi:hypothetical protein
VAKNCYRSHGGVKTEMTLQCNFLTPTVFMESFQQLLPATDSSKFSKINDWTIILHSAGGVKW